MGKLEGKVAVITGAASGMGRATAIRFGKEGAAVVVADLNSQAGEETISEIAAAGGNAVFQHTDVSSDRDLKALFDRAVKEYGRLDITYNNAGIGGATGKLTDIGADDWDKTFVILTRAVFLGIRYSIEPMRKAGGGSIISTASVAGLKPAAGLHAYSAAKAAVVSLTQSAAIELGHDRIRVNCICPAELSPHSSIVECAVARTKPGAIWRADSRFRVRASPRISPRWRPFWPAMRRNGLPERQWWLNGGMNTGNVRINFAPGFSGPSFQRPDRTSEPPRAR